MDENTEPLPKVTKPLRRGRLVGDVLILITALALLGGTAWAIWMRGEADAIASPAPTPSARPAAEPSPTPTGEPVVEPPMVALTRGELVLLDPDTGATLQVIASGLPTSFMPPTLTITEDRTTAYFDAPVNPFNDTPEESDPWQIMRVSLADGSVQVFTDGYRPSVSPDGSTLAYCGPDPESDSGTTGINFLSLHNGDVRHVSSDITLDWWFGQPAWSSDGSQVFVSVAPGVALTLVVLDVATASDIDDATVVGPPADLHPPESWHIPILLADGRLAFAGLEAGDAAPIESRYVGILDLASADVERVDEFTGFEIWDFASNPHEVGLAVVMSSFGIDTGGHPHLYRWDQDGGLRLLREDVLAVAW